MREISCSLITEKVAEMCISANKILPLDVEAAVRGAYNIEETELGKHVLKQLAINLDVARDKDLPICQDTGMAILFVTIGQDVHITGGSLTDALNEGVSRGYTEGYLRKSIVGDPVERKNTGDNTPAVIHYEIVPGDELTITMMAKGAGSENKSRLFMLKPSDGLEGIKKAVLTAVQDAGADSCPPMFIGVGIGGTFEKCAILAKKALSAGVQGTEQDSRPEWIKSLESTLLEEINRLPIGPAGLGGSVTALSVRVEAYATHIASLPVAVNTCCHVNRHISCSL
ncbi:MAG: fumarate hydratase [Lachnospiraceae bacterium]|nr:fumarate hydratase [Lachnospiraceae bacterium]